MEWTRRSVLLGALGTAGVALTGCGPAPASPTPPTTPGAAVPTASASATPPPDGRPRWPLTGRLLDDPAAARHAAVAVKVPDNRNEHPQVGINDADLVFVQLEGYPDAAGQSSTRLMPVYHSVFPESAAPVRSMRPVDVPLLAPVGSLIGSTGAAPWVEAYVRSFADLVDGTHTYVTSKGTGAYSIDPGRVRVYQGQKYYDRAVACHPGVLSKLATGPLTQGPRQPYLPFATTDAEVSTAQGQPAEVVRVPWKTGDTYDMVYEFHAASGRYRRSMPWGPHVQADGQRVTTDNVLVVRAVQRTAKLYPGKGAAEPVHDLIDATGTFVYAHGGAHVTGTWSKAAVDAPFAFTLEGGAPLRVAPGRTFVELVAPDAVVRYA